MNSRLEELQATHKAEYATLHKKYEAVKVLSRTRSQRTRAHNGRID